MLLLLSTCVSKNLHKHKDSKARLITFTNVLMFGSVTILGINLTIMTYIAFQNVDVYMFKMQIRTVHLVGHGETLRRYRGYLLEF